MQSFFFQGGTYIAKTLDHTWAYYDVGHMQSMRDSSSVCGSRGGRMGLQGGGEGAATGWDDERQCPSTTVYQFPMWPLGKLIVDPWFKYSLDQ